MNRRPYLAHRAPVLTDTPVSQARQWFAPQGRPEQGWPVRRCSPEMGANALPAQVAPAEACTELGADAAPRRQQPLSPAEAWLLMVIYIVSCCIAAAVLCLVVDWLRVAA